MSATVLACDLGTSSCKLAVFDQRGAVVGAAGSGYASATRGAEVEQDPWDWLRAFQAAVTTLDAEGHLADIACLAFTGQMSATLAVEAQAVPLRQCLIWSDQRATIEAEEVAGVIGHDSFYRITGNPISPTYTIAKALWIARHEPDVYQATAKFLQPKDWVIAQLTGILAVDLSDASCTGLLDLERGAWSHELARAVGLDVGKLPDIVPTAQVIGHVTAQGARISGLRPGLPVVPGGGDGPTSALGAGVVRPGQSYVSLGTSAWVSFVSAAPLGDPRRRLFSLRHVVEGLFAHTGATQNAGNVLAWLAGDILGSRSLDESLATTQAGADGLMCLPYLNGERTPYWDADASGSFFGLRPQHRGEHLVRAMAEGICHHLRLITDVFAELGLSSSEVVALGGLAESPTFVRLLAASTGRPHRVVQSPNHATCRGAAMLGAVGVGLCASLDAISGWVTHSPAVDADPADQARLDRDHAAFLDLYECLRPLFARCGSMPAS